MQNSRSLKEAFDSTSYHTLLYKYCYTLLYLSYLLNDIIIIIIIIIMIDIIIIIFIASFYDKIRALNILLLLNFIDYICISFLSVNFSL